MIPEPPLDRPAIFVAQNHGPPSRRVTTCTTRKSRRQQGNDGLSLKKAHRRATNHHSPYPPRTTTDLLVASILPFLDRPQAGTRARPRGEQMPQSFAALPLPLPLPLTTHFHTPTPSNQPTMNTHTTTTTTISRRPLATATTTTTTRPPRRFACCLPVSAAFPVGTVCGVRAVRWRSLQCHGLLPSQFCRHSLALATCRGIVGVSNNHV